MEETSTSMFGLVGKGRIFRLMYQNDRENTCPVHKSDMHCSYMKTTGNPVNATRLCDGATASFGDDSNVILGQQILIIN